MKYLIVSLLFIVNVNGGGVWTTSSSRCKTDKSEVLATSLSRTEETIKIHYFRGGGSAEESDEPLVNSSVIYFSLFDKDGFSAVFTPKIDQPVFEQERNFSVHSFHSTRQFTKIPLKVIDASRPITIGSTSLYYFWGTSYLPGYKSEECVHYTTMNDKREIKLCNVTEMDRCAANISDFPHLAPLSFFTTKGERLTQFSWLCPKGQSCCAYECCDLPEWLVGILVMGSFGVLILMCVIIICVKAWVDKRNEWRGARRKSLSPVTFARVSSDPRIWAHNHENPPAKSDTPVDSVESGTIEGTPLREKE